MTDTHSLERPELGRQTERQRPICDTGPLEYLVGEKPKNTPTTDFRFWHNAVAKRLLRVDLEPLDV